MSKGSAWYLEELSEEAEIRRIFGKLLQICFGKNAGSGFICGGKWKSVEGKDFDIGERPFLNAFNKSQKAKTAFTKVTLARFLALVVREDKIKEVIEFIRGLEYLGEFDFASANYEMFRKCNKIAEDNSGDKQKTGECINNIASYDYVFDKKCYTCPICMIYKGLQYIEKNYKEFVYRNKSVLSEYKEYEDKALVEEIFQAISDFEIEFDVGTFDEAKVCELYNKCIKCVGISDVLDEKLAYIKLYTARFLNWPYFKSCLFELGYYNVEGIVYLLLNSALNIIMSCEEKNVKLLFEIETERIISYISLAYQKPFELQYCGKHEGIILSGENILEFADTDEARLALYIELWNLSVHLFKTHDAEEYMKKIEELLSDNDNNLLIKELAAKYYIYRYMNAWDERENTKNKLAEISSVFRKSGVYSDTLEIALALFLDTDCKNPNRTNANGNYYAEIKKIYGYGLEEEMKIGLPQCPSRYKRVFGDNMLGEYLSRYRNQRR